MNIHQEIKDLEITLEKLKKKALIPDGRVAEGYDYFTTTNFGDCLQVCEDHEPEDDINFALGDYFHTEEEWKIANERRIAKTTVIRAIRAKEIELGVCLTDEERRELYYDVVANRIGINDLTSVFTEEFELLSTSEVLEAVLKGHEPDIRKFKGWPSK